MKIDIKSTDQPNRIKFILKIAQDAVIFVNKFQLDSRRRKLPERTVCQLRVAVEIWRRFEADLNDNASSDRIELKRLLIENFKSYRLV